MHNSDTTIGENVRYFMYEYMIVYDDWFNDISNIFKRIDNQIKNTKQHIMLYCFMYVIKIIIISPESIHLIYFHEVIRMIFYD